MITLGDVFRQSGPSYRARFGNHMSAEQHQAMRAIEQCRTAALGGHVYTCEACAETRYSYHSCRNRHCPTCQHGAAQHWLTQQQALLLPVPYFLVTFTLPASLRQLARQQPGTIYNLLFRTSAAALQQLAQDPRFLGGRMGMIGVLQTWTRDLRYHPHVHYLVPALGLGTDGRWIVGRRTFLVHAKPLALLFRAKFRAGLRQAGLEQEVDGRTWDQAWVIDCRPVGSGQAALTYLAPYIFRVALSNNRIEQYANEQVTFRYTEGATGRIKRCTLPANVFIKRFVQHVLPKGFVKVRYYGLLRLGNRHLLKRAQAALAPPLPAKEAPSLIPALQAPSVVPVVLRCPTCGQAMQVTHVIPRRCRTVSSLEPPVRQPSRAPPVTSNGNT